jgi:hypothetical protein
MVYWVRFGSITGKSSLSKFQLSGHAVQFRRHSQSAHLTPRKCVHFHQVSAWGEGCLWSHFLYHYVVCTMLFKKNRTLSKNDPVTKYHMNIQYAPNCIITINFPIFGLENRKIFRHKWAPVFIKATAVFSTFLITLNFWLGLFLFLVLFRSDLASSQYSHFLNRLWFLHTQFNVTWKAYLPRSSYPEEGTLLTVQPNIRTRAMLRYNALYWA